MNINELYKELSELQDKALEMIERKEFTSAHKLHKQMNRIKLLIKQESGRC